MRCRAFPGDTNLSPFLFTRRTVFTIYHAIYIDSVTSWRQAQPSPKIFFVLFRWITGRSAVSISKGDAEIHQ